MQQQKQILLSAKRQANTDPHNIILQEACAFPPPERCITEILVSQYATSLIDDALKNTAQDKLDRKTKLPLPVIFAYLVINSKQKNFQGSLRLLLNNVQKKGLENGFIICYNISRLYLQIGNIKKAGFYLESLLKEQPFFVYGIYDHCRLIAYQFNKVEEALKILERHLKGSLQNSSHLQNLYLELTSKSATNIKSVAKILHTKEMSVTNYFNLALMLKKSEDYVKSEQMFKEIIRILENEKDRYDEENQLFSKKDQKILTFSKINLLEIYEINISKNVFRRSYQQKLVDLCSSFEENFIINSQSLCKIKKKSEPYEQDIENGDLLFIDTAINTENALFEAKSIEKQNKHEIKQKVVRLKQFNKEFAEKRQKNTKKLKYLLMKQKQINNFFKNISLKKDKESNYIFKANKNVVNQSSNRSFNKNTSFNKSINSTIIDLNDDEIEEFEKEFEDKKKNYALKYNNVEIDEILKEILLNLGSSKRKKQKPTQEQSNNIAIKKRQSLNSIKSKTTDRSQKFRIKAVLSRQKIEQLPSSPQKTFQASTFQLSGFNPDSLSKFNKLRSNKNSKQIKDHIKIDSPRKQSDHKRQINSTSSINSNLDQYEKMMKIGENLQKSNKYSEAYELYTTMYKIFKTEIQKQQILLKIGNLFEKEQKYEEAEKTYQKCCKLNAYKGFVRQGELLLRVGRIKSGVQNLEKANCLKRFDLEIQNKLVYGYSMKQDTIEKALTLAHTILKKQPQSLQTLIMTANILQKQGKIKQAIEIVTALDQFKQAQFIKFYLGQLYTEDSNITKAFTYFKQALDIKPDHIPSLIEVATILSDMKPKQSVAILNKVIQMDKENQKALTRLGKIYENNGDLESAMNVYRRSLECRKNYQSLLKLGDCLVKKENYSEALGQYKEALTIKKTHEILAKIASIYFHKKQYPKSIEYFNQAIDEIPSDFTFNQKIKHKKKYLFSIGKLHSLMLNYDMAILAIQRVLEYEQSRQLYKTLAQSYFGKYEYSTALEFFQKANQFEEEEDVEILENMAICFDKLEEYLASKAIYQHILERDPNNTKCINNLANILLILGQTNQAFYLFESMLEKLPTNLQKRLRVADIYAAVGDWSKVEYHLSLCNKQKENDARVIEKLVVLYKEKRDVKMINKYEKKLNLIRLHMKKTGGS